MAVNRAASDLKIASEKITGASGGYIRINFGGDGKTAALLIMDTEDISTAQNVWVFNQGGLGHFPNGYDPTAQANVALTADGWVAASRISGEMISGVGIENVDNALTTKPKIALANGCIHFTETYSYDGQTEQVTDIGKLEYLPRSGQNNPATLALTVQNGNNISIGEYGYPKFVYISDHGNDETFRMYGKMKMWDDSGVSAVYSAQALIDIVDGGAKNKAKEPNIVRSTSGWTPVIESYIPAGEYQLTFNYSAGNVAQFVITNANGNTLKAITPTIPSGTGAYSETFTLTSDGYGYRCYANAALNLSYIMITPKVLFDISPNYVPYCPSLKELYDMIQNL